HPRPVEYLPPSGRRPRVDPAFLMSDPSGWKETRPFPSGERTPQPDEKTSGQFPLGVAVEADLPRSWQPDQDKVRVAAIGHGGVFVGGKLSPVREKLLADVCNWLLGRDDLLSNEEVPWEYPRVQLSDRAHRLWLWGIRLGVPVAFAFLGVVVLMRRAIR